MQNQNKDQKILNSDIPKSGGYKEKEAGYKYVHELAYADNSAKKTRQRLCENKCKGMSENYKSFSFLSIF